MRERLTVMTRDEGLYSFWQPAESAPLSWWAVADGVFSVVESFSPSRRVRYFPVVSIEWWEHETVEEA